MHLRSHKKEGVAGASLHSHVEAAEGLPPGAPTLLQGLCALLARRQSCNGGCRQAGAGVLPGHQCELHALRQAVLLAVGPAGAGDCHCRRCMGRGPLSGRL